MRAKNRIIRLRHKNPLMSNAEIGRQIGVSRDYVGDILKKNGLVTRVPHKPYVKYCDICGNPRAKQRRIPVCSSRCRFLYFRIRVTCSYCKIDFYLKRGEVVQRYRRGYNNIYCSQKCHTRKRYDD